MSNLEAFVALATLIVALLGQGYLIDRRSTSRIDRLEDHMHARFEAADAKVDAKIDALEAKFDRRFESVDRRFESVDRRFEQVDRRFEQMHQQMFALATGLKPLVEQAEDLAKRRSL